MWPWAMGGHLEEREALAGISDCPNIATMPSALNYTTTSDGYSIAYSIQGKGVPLVLMQCILQGDIEKAFDIPAFRSLYDPLAARYQLIQYDPRGTGNSTRGIGPGHTMSDTMLDLEAVTEAAGVSTMVLVAVNFACYTAMRFAERYPERVDALILVNPSPLRGEPLMPSWRDFYTNSWETFIEAFVSTGTPGGDDMRDVLATAVTQADFIAIANGGVGHAIEDVIPAVTVPTLVLASRNYLNPLYMPAANEVASGVQNGRIVHFDGTKNADFMMTNDGTVPRGVQTILDFLEELGVDRPYINEAANGTHPPSGRGEITSLSPRQREVLALIAQGKTNREIAGALVLSERTVQRHIADLYLKIDVRNRAEATSFALAQPA
jgi:pimeloyl-ACP methyl ester carboxylesterase/DNA-binding CsgD family transcriptional regulator